MRGSALTEKAGPDDIPTQKYIMMFERRATSGQCYQQPCLGTREFAAAFRLLPEDEPDPPADTDRAIRRPAGCSTTSTGAPAPRRRDSSTPRSTPAG